jgi:hypothetical protein
VDAAGAPVPVRRDDESWGMLPARVRENFRNWDSDEVPSRYREWIDLYYARLNKTR